MNGETVKGPITDSTSPRNSRRSGARPPISTYRLQLQPAFAFADASAIVPYLDRLGITDAYCSPLFQTKPGSTHGYDVCDFGRLNSELGGEPGFDAFSTELVNRRMGLVLDIVPNHMAVEPVINPWWREMLEHGQAAPSSKFFDVDWNPVKPELRGKILLPFLGDYYGSSLERGELTLVFQGGELAVKYGDLTRPLDPRTYPMVLRRIPDATPSESGDDDPHGQEFLSILAAFENLPAATDPDPDRLRERLRESRFAKERLDKLAGASPLIRLHIEEALQSINGTPGLPDSFDGLHEILEAQSYRLAYWKTASHEINYRRFFDINQLAGLRVEEPTVFATMHALVLRLIAEGKVTGLRLDHIDGLFDPAGYLDRLQEAIREQEGEEAPTESATARPFYVLVEKILSGNEVLPRWPVEGTTGYDFMNDVSRVLVNPRNARAMRQVHERFTGQVELFSDMVYECKKLITWTSLAAEMNVLAHMLNGLSEGDRRARDFTLDSLREALREVAACFPIYRTYLGTLEATEAERDVVDHAIHWARRRNPAMEVSVFEFVRGALLPDPGEHSEQALQARLRFAMKFQQYTGPLQAKGIEDTSFYRYNVLVSLNEVGGEPHHFGGTIDQFHEVNQNRAQHSPRGMLATATHDTKRGEDARTRIHVLSEVPATWEKRVRRWAAINADCRTNVNGVHAPDRNDEYLFYQTILGCWPEGLTEPTTPPEFIARVRDYMLKATKEAKVHTSWITPNEAYDSAVTRFVEESLAGPRSVEFLTRFLPFQRRMAHAGMVNSLAQVVLKLMSPGVPDFYQGTELWDLSLVDPDNRRPVDFQQRSSFLEELEPWLDDQESPTIADQSATVASWLANWTDGRIKMFVTLCGLHLRRKYPTLFSEGEYLPIATEGEHVNHVIALARRLGNDWTFAIVPRLSFSLTGPRPVLPVGVDVWGDTLLRFPKELTAPVLRNILTRKSVELRPGSEGFSARLSDILTFCPVALLRIE